MTHVVVGANGFLGSALARRLAAAGGQVVAVVRRGRDRVPKGVEHIVSSDDLGAVAASCTGDVTVFVAAAYIPAPGGEPDDARLRTSNVVLPHRVAEAFPEARIVLASSVAVYGAGGRTIREDSEVRDAGAYGRSKLAGEVSVALHRDAIVLRYGSLYGTGMRHETFLPAIVRRAVEERRIVLFGDGAREQDYLHVDDAVALAVSAAESGRRGVYLGVSGRSSSNREVAEIVASKLADCRVEFAGTDVSESYRYDPTRTRDEISFTPSISLETGLAEMVNRAA